MLKAWYNGMPNITLENLKAALQSIRQLLGRKAEEPDWNQNDPKSPSYIRNRPFYSEIKHTKILNGTFDFTENYGAYDTQLPTFDIVVGKSYTVIWDGVPYQVDGKDFLGNLLLGNLFMMTGDTNDDTGEPFLIGRENNSNLVVTLDASSKHSISIIGDIETIYPIDKKYLSDHNFMITVTVTDIETPNGITTSAVCDKTYDEIFQAYKEGRYIYADVHGLATGGISIRLPLTQLPKDPPRYGAAVFFVMNLASANRMEYSEITVDCENNISIVQNNFNLR